ncbi:MAG: hypothetical protein WCP60_10690 [bacterium]
MNKLHHSLGFYNAGDPINSTIDLERAKKRSREIDDEIDDLRDEIRSLERTMEQIDADIEKYENKDPADPESPIGKNQKEAQVMAATDVVLKIKPAFFC